MRKLSGLGKGERKGGERSGSLGNIQELWKRKKEDMEGEKELKKQEKWALRGGKRLQRLSRKETMTGPEKGEKEKRI